MDRNRNVTLVSLVKPFESSTVPVVADLKRLLSLNVSSTDTLAETRRKSMPSLFRQASCGNLTSRSHATESVWQTTPWPSVGHFKKDITSKCARFLDTYLFSNGNTCKRNLVIPQIYYNSFCDERNGRR